jgi:hypothetical protein
VKALDRLIGGAIDIPAAWLAQKKAKIDAQTDAYKAVEAAIAKAAATEAGADPAVVSRAVEVLVRKSYREQHNREAVAKATVEELQSPQPDSQENAQETPTEEPDEEWLNVFEQYAERASTERMQRLWGRVLAGEIRKPGRFSMRTLRFLSEFSQADALAFAELCENAFAGAAPSKLAKPSGEDADIRKLLFMETAGLIEGASGLGLELTIKFNDGGLASLIEDRLALVMRGTPNTRIKVSMIALTPMAQELVSLIPQRDPLKAAERVAEAIREPTVTSAFVAFQGPKKALIPFRVLWNETEKVPTTAD